MAMKVCKDCGTEVSKSADSCPKCGRKMKSPVLRIIVGIIILIIGIVSLATDMSEITSNNEDTSQEIVTKENYNKINKGMSEEEVEAILGEPASTSESETPGIGTMVIKHYQETLSFKAIEVYFLDGKVYMKNWTEL